MKQVNRQKYPHIVVEEIKGKNVNERLNKLCEESDADLLAFTHYKDSFFSRLFSHSNTRAALGVQKLPVMIFPANME